MSMTPTRFTKHEGLGNDFLILLDDQQDRPGQQTVALGEETIRRICDRHLGVGADGLIRAVPAAGPADAVMELYNADGSRAEMSGNGVRCLAQALLLDGWARPPRVTVATDAGPRTIEVVDGPTSSPEGLTTHRLTVDMGVVHVHEDAPEWALGHAFKATWADAGNPHLLVEVADPGSVDAVDLVALGEKVNAATPAGANVHLVARGDREQEIVVRTYERGVGPTQACGTGACAAAVVAGRWGLVDGADVLVSMPGGQAGVAMGETVKLTGPATAVASVDYPWP